MVRVSLASLAKRTQVSAHWRYRYGRTSSPAEARTRKVSCCDAAKSRRYDSISGCASKRPPWYRAAFDPTLGYPAKVRRVGAGGRTHYDLFACGAKIGPDLSDPTDDLVEFRLGEQFQRYDSRALLAARLAPVASGKSPGCLHHLPVGARYIPQSVKEKGGSNERPFCVVHVARLQQRAVVRR